MRFIHIGQVHMRYHTSQEDLNAGAWRVIEEMIG